MPFDLAALIPMSLGVSAGWAPNQTAQYKRQDTEDHDLTHHVQRCHETDVAAQVSPAIAAIPLAPPGIQPNRIVTMERSVGAKW